MRVTTPLSVEGGAGQWRQTVEQILAEHSRGAVGPP